MSANAVIDLGSGGLEMLDDDFEEEEEEVKVAAPPEPVAVTIGKTNIVVNAKDVLHEVGLEDVLVKSSSADIWLGKPAPKEPEPEPEAPKEKAPEPAAEAVPEAPKKKKRTNQSRHGDADRAPDELCDKQGFPRGTFFPTQAMMEKYDLKSIVPEDILEFVHNSESLQASHRTPRSCLVDHYAPNSAILEDLLCQLLGNGTPNKKNKFDALFPETLKKALMSPDSSRTFLPFLLSICQSSKEDPVPKFDELCAKILSDHEKKNAVVLRAKPSPFHTRIIVTKDRHVFAVPRNGRAANAAAKTTTFLRSSVDLFVARMVGALYWGFVMVRLERNGLEKNGNISSVLSVVRKMFGYDWRHVNTTDFLVAHRHKTLNLKYHSMVEFLTKILDKKLASEFSVWRCIFSTYTFSNEADRINQILALAIFFLHQSWMSFIAQVSCHRVLNRKSAEVTAILHGDLGKDVSARATLFKLFMDTFYKTKESRDELCKYVDESNSNADKFAIMETALEKSAKERFAEIRKQKKDQQATKTDEDDDEDDGGDEEEEEEEEKPKKKKEEEEKKPAKKKKPAEVEKKKKKKPKKRPEPESESSESESESEPETKKRKKKITKKAAPPAKRAKKKQESESEEEEEDDDDMDSFIASDDDVLDASTGDESDDEEEEEEKPKIKKAKRAIESDDDD